MVTSVLACAAFPLQAIRSSQPMLSVRTRAHRTVHLSIAIMFQLSPIETNSIIGAVLCFAVGFGACLLVVYYLLPALVHAQCVEIVREYVDYTRRESDIRIVVLDRESSEPLQKPRRVYVPAADATNRASYESQTQLRVDRPTPPARATPDEPTEIGGHESPDSMLAQIYEQNLQLRDQLRRQSRSVKQ